MNFTETPPVQNPREFLAVILAGFGNELSPLTSDYGDEPCPKALLPIGNKPMISYPLAWLEEAGIKDVLLICPPSHREPISHHIHSGPASGAPSALRVEIQVYEQSQQLSAGTCSVLKHFAHRIDGDFVLLPCDFLPPPSLRLSTVLNKFRVESITDGAIMTSLWFEHKPPEKEKTAVEDAWPMPSAPPPIVYDEKTGTLLHIDTPDDVDQNEEEMELRMGMLWKYPRTKLTTNFMDAHVYICKRAVLDALAQKSHFDSIREEFIPWLCKVQSQKTKREKYGSVFSTITNDLALQHSTLHLPPKVPRATSQTSPTRTTNSNSHASAVTDASSTAPPSPTTPWPELSDERSLRCGIVIHRIADGYAARANNVWSYLELNKVSLKDLPAVSHDPNFIDPKSSIAADSLIGESTQVGERSSVKRSVVGRHCVIGKNVNILGSVLMDHCIIEDGARLEGCLLGKNTRVRSKGELVRCITQAGFEVEAGGAYKYEKLDVADWATTAQVSDDESGSGTEDEDDEDDD